MERELGVTSPTSGRINELEKLGTPWKCKASLLNFVIKGHVEMGKEQKGAQSSASPTSAGRKLAGQVRCQTVFVILQCGA